MRSQPFINYYDDLYLGEIGLRTPCKLSYEAVRERVEQGLAQLKNVDSLKLSDLGFLRVLMTMVIMVFYIGPSLPSDDVTSEIFHKNCFQRDVVWRQRRPDVKNHYDHRHQHPQEPQIREFQRIDIFELCQTPPDLLDSLANGLIYMLQFNTTIHFQIRIFGIDGQGILYSLGDRRSVSHSGVPRIPAHQDPIRYH
ncbi:hypothetical protein PRIPAC_95703, partial [Pristionchus pacificus]|uniref:Uncharacterized protein n=1 Tax=Pristionchus pacificus TaxID=54126 RepID=A0A2A6D1V6_PRIPA